MSNKTIDSSHLTSLFSCQQEEADTRMMMHLLHSVEQGHAKAYLRTVSSDVVVLAINFFKELGLTKLWIGFGTGKSYKDIPIHEITQLLGPQHCTVLPFVNAFTGCDVLSAMFGIGKKTAWNALLSFHEVINTIIAITKDLKNLTLDSVHMRRLERWTVLMYSKNCGAESSNDARKIMFTSGLRFLDAIPQPSTLYFNMLSVPCSLLPLCGSNHYARIPNYHNQMGLGMEHQNQAVDATLDRSGRCQPCMLIAIL